MVCCFTYKFHLYSGSGNKVFNTPTFPQFFLYPLLTFTTDVSSWFPVITKLPWINIRREPSGASRTVSPNALLIERESTPSLS